MAFCQNCGAQLEDSYKFCNVCGAMVTPVQVPAQPAAGPEIVPAEPWSAQQPAAPEADLLEDQQSAEPVVPAEETWGAQQPTEPAAPAADPWEAPQTPQPESEPWNAAPQQRSEAAAWGAQQQAQNAWNAQQNPAYGAGYGYTQPPKKSGKGCIIAVIIAVVLVFALVAGAVAFFLVGVDKIGADDPNLGTYIGTKASMWGVDVNLTDILADGFVIELKAGGICRVTGGGENGTGKWTLEGDVITIKDGETTIVGTLEDGVMVFENMMDMGMDVVFYKEDMDIPEDVTVNADHSWWNGEWYGWWTTSSCEGDFADWEDGWWDCCAEITMDANGKGHLLLWDEDLPKDNALAEIDLTLTEGDDEKGIAVTKSGYFMDRNVSDGDYMLQPTVDGYDNLLCMDGWYETEDGGFYFEVYLRPWGQLWDDMIADDEGYAPYFYEQYVQALENGESAPDDIYDAWG
ncbi:MAG: zinc-ribbon domain-containing protein [Ruminococcaceae bacterium]|nr:zinc-ribbon domain-containing protein [Oscillospiraceae bacterium]